MPPVSTLKLASVLRNSAEHRRLLALAAFCCIALIVWLSFKVWRKGIHTNIQIKQRRRQDQKLGLMDTYSTYTDDSYRYYPPPKGTPITLRQKPICSSILYSTSGDLAAQVLAEQWPAAALNSDDDLRHPWRRQSFPPPTATSDHEAGVSITRDGEQYFEDLDLNGIWRRRTLEFA